jgi:hypothetical protein
MVTNKLSRTFKIAAFSAVYLIVEIHQLTLADPPLPATTPLTSADA